jgi:voltage-gated potassium channel
MKIKTIYLAYIIGMFVLLLVGTTLTYVVGQNGGFNVPITSFVTALYFTVATVTTVGYGDIFPVTDGARVFVILLIIVGISVIFGGLVQISGEFVNSRIERLSGRLTGVERRLLSDHIVLVGYGHVNAAVASILKEESRRFVLIAQDKETADMLRARDYNAYYADPTSETDMLALNLHKAERIVIDLTDSSKTVHAALVAKSLAKGRELIVVAPTPETVRYLIQLEIKYIVDPAEMAANRINNMLKITQLTTKKWWKVKKRKK